MVNLEKNKLKVNVMFPLAAAATRYEASHNGSIMYLAGDLASIAAPGSVADADVLVVLAEAAGGQPPVTKNAPPSVELVTYGKRGRMAVFVMNETTNPFENTSLIRYVVPPPDIEIRVKTDVPVSSVTGVTGRPVRYEVHDQWLTVRLPKIADDLSHCPK